MTDVRKAWALAYKARDLWGVLTARLKPCPFKTYSSPSSNLPKVGLCFCDFVLRFLSAGSVRVLGGVPITARAAAFTAAAARNGFGFRGFEGMVRSLDARS
jgi:hypothetical protein